jgi:hypothetical protein
LVHRWHDVAAGLNRGLAFGLFAILTFPSVVKAVEYIREALQPRNTSPHKILVDLTLYSLFTATNFSYQEKIQIIDIQKGINQKGIIRKALKV